jgi:hypothetical protein
MTDSKTIRFDSSERLLKLFVDVLDHAAQMPPPKLAGLDGRKGLARAIALSVVDDVLRLDSELRGADWSPKDIALLKEKAHLALKAMNESV